MELKPSVFQMAVASEAGILAQARSMLDWIARNRFCSTCGHKTNVVWAGYKRECSNPACNTHVGVQNVAHPRTDPVVIVLVLSKDRQRCLLGRKPQFAKSYYSCIAGFVEPGESVEDAVRREVFEETGVVVSSVSYHSSQPWPFPANLMLGCLAEAETEDIVCDNHELEDVRWFAKEKLLNSLELNPSPNGEDGIHLPLHYTISNRLLRTWLDHRH